MLIEFDSKIKLDMIQLGYTNIFFLSTTYTYRHHLHSPPPNTNLELHHIDQDMNKCADILAH